MNQNLLQTNETEKQPVVVVGATGGVGQLVVAQLLQRDYPVRVLVRNRQKAQQLFGDQVALAQGNLVVPETLPPALEQVGAIICATGTTAFPSARWGFQFPQNLTPMQRALAGLRIYFDRSYRYQIATNSPVQIDNQGVKNLVAAIPSTLQRLVLVSSCGVLRKQDFPFTVLNQFGVLDAKLAAEQAVQASGVPYTIVRPGRLIDGPYTSYDLNTLVKATTQNRLGVKLGTGDRLSGQTSRIDLAAACVACLGIPQTENRIFELINEGKRTAAIPWTDRLAHLWD
jgi:uncharacterized protein YbjT (DUF2867 family)